MGKQSSIDWLIEQCPRINTIASLELIEKAKAMHKEEIIKAFGYEEIDAEQYYQEIFGDDMVDVNWIDCYCGDADACGCEPKQTVTNSNGLS